MTSNDSELDADDVTLPAGGDVVAQIRAHAAKVRRGEAAPGDDIEVWTPAEEASTQEIGAGPGQLLPHDDTVAFTAQTPVIDLTQEAATEVGPAPEVEPVPEVQPELPPVKDLRLAAGASLRDGESLIDGQAPPDVSATFWTSERPFRASGIDEKPRRSLGGPAPLWVWVAVVSILIVALSIAIALVLS